MNLTDAQLIDSFSDMVPEDLIAAMLEVRAELLAEGECPMELAALLGRLCSALGLDPVKLRRAMH